VATSDATYRRARFGGGLRQLREQRKLTQRAVATAAGVGVDKINRVESGRVALDMELLRTLLDIYEVQDRALRAALEAMVENLSLPGWWQTYALAPALRDFLGLEQDASAVWAWEPLLVHGRLQTERYAEHLMLSGDDVVLGGKERVASMVTVRMKRQRAVTNRLTVILGAAALQTVVGGPDVMREQIAHLLTRTDVELRILPLGRPHVGLDGAFTLLDFPDGGRLAAVENLVTTAYIDDQDSLDVYGRAADQLTKLALDPSASRTLLEDHVRAL
jgi:transcriptional regulator with XRE-family HTH domain